MAIDPICGMALEPKTLPAGTDDEENTEHPLATAIVQGAKKQNIVFEDVKDFRSVTAGGVFCTVAGHAVLVGKPDFLRSEKISGLEPLEASAEKLQEEGKTAMFVAIDGKPAGILAVADPIKSTTAEAISRFSLQRAGYSGGGGSALPVLRLVAQSGHCRRSDEPELRLGHQ